MTEPPEADGARLRRLLGGAELTTLRRRLRARYERGESRDSFTLSGLTPDERSALESLLGRPARYASSMRIKRSELDAIVARAGLAADFRAALEKLDGPLIDRKAERAARERGWARVLADVKEPRLRLLVSSVAGAALLKRFATGDPGSGQSLLERAHRVLERLPAPGIPLAQLAAESLGDSHALDAGQAVAAIVLRALYVESLPARAMTAESNDEIATELRHPGDIRRDHWARAGVTVNELAAPALCLNLRSNDDTPAGMLATRAAERGEPVHLNLRALLRSPPSWDVLGRAVYVCENAAVIAIAADRLARDAAPLVCTDGMPGAAQQTLLRQLVDRGALLRYHGDFDWPGVVIGNFVVRNFAAQPWRFSAMDYREARTDIELPLSGRPMIAEWDRDLADAMAERNTAVHEEAVIDSLLRDLVWRA